MARHCRVLAVVALLLSLLEAAQGQRRLLQATLKGKAIILSVRLHGNKHKEILAVHTASGQRLQVNVANSKQLRGIHTGMHIEVTGRWAAAAPAAGTVQAAAAGSSGRTFQAVTIRASGAAVATPTVSRAAAAGGAAAAAVSASASAPLITLSTNQLVTSAVSTLVIPIAAVDAGGQACPGTEPPRASVADVKRTVFAESNPNGTTVGSTYNKCSYGKSKLTAANSRVADLAELPCAGNNNGVAWTFSKCDFDDFNGYADAADALMAARGVDMSKYKYRVYLIPPAQCGFVGLGYVGCDGSYDCRAWLTADFWTSPQAIAHELGHNLFMSHAGAYNADGAFDEYADNSCFMGYCCSDRCPNTPHAWQLGWLTVQQLDAGSLRAGATVTVALASQAASGRSGLRILPSWTAGVDPIFLGFRTRAGGDAALGEDAAGRVHVYQAAITGTFDPQLTTWRAALKGAGDAWEQSSAGLVVRVRSVGAGAATVSVCRRGGAETALTCAAGMDNDCNGLVGRDDPACAQFVARVRRQPARRAVRRASAKPAA